MDVAVQPAISQAVVGDVTRSEGRWWRATGRVDGEKDALSDGVDEDSASGIDERQEPGRFE
jgi:hypothetical protein